ncbi:hypothetical protein FDUTEX481_08824 [Tolypothrix sp. PCC 7601]|nr:hypothetical protein FDUTEX481_08824 [Tolypothrix sp. PCC 7601]
MPMPLQSVAFFFQIGIKFPLSPFPFPLSPFPFPLSPFPFPPSPFTLPPSVHNQTRI